MLVFFYLPIIILVVNSFNASRFGTGWQGFSLRWYARLLHEPEIWRAARNSLVIALGATALSVVFGTTAAFALHRFARSRLQRFHYGLVYTPLVVPEILMGISLLMAFAAAGVRLGLGTIFLAHVTFCVSFVAMTVLARLQDFDYAVVEAAQDLGAGWGTTLRRVLLPMHRPGDRRRGAPRLHPVHRRFRHHVLRRRPGFDDPAHPDLQHDQVSARLRSSTPCRPSCSSSPSPPWP